jgi:hypothetical protein
MTPETPILVGAIEIGEPNLADRLTALADVQRLRLAAPGEPGDAALFGLSRTFRQRATLLLRRQARWATALRRLDERRTAATPAIPPKPRSIIAHVAGSGALAMADPVVVSRTSANQAQ